MRLRTLAFLAAASWVASCLPAGAVPAAGAAPQPSPNIAVSPSTLPYEGVRAIGTPRVATRHPNVFWDQEDIDHFKTMLKTSRELQIQFEALKRRMDEAVDQPVSIPEPQKGPDGQWLYPGDYFPRFPGAPENIDPLTNFSRHFNKAAETVSDLGTVYVLTGDEKYARTARDILIGYANCPRYGAPKGMDKRSGRGLLGQLLDEALVLQVLTRGYDLISSSRSVSPEDRVRIHDELLRPLASEMIYPAWPDLFGPGSTFASQVNNRGALAAASVLLVGYATDDEELVNAALYGTRSTLPYSDKARRKLFPPPKDWTAATADNPSDGLLAVFFAPPAIPGGAWVEGTAGYTLYPLGSLVNAAEAAWRHGLDLYSYNNAIFKHIFDYLIDFSYPDLTLPAENDAHRDHLVYAHPPFAPVLYEYAYRRYGDPRYLAVINSPRQRAYLAWLRASGTPRPPLAQSYRNLSMLRGWGLPPSFLYDLDPILEPPRIDRVSVNYRNVGYGVLRAPSPDGHGLTNLILSYGPSASHGHPDKLHVDLFAFGDVLMPSPGVSLPYSSPLLPNWFLTTVAHNTLVVDQGVQKFHLPNRREPDVVADQTVFAPGETLGLERAWTDTAYPGVRMDRAVFLTGRYFADLFSATSDRPHVYDLAWHIRGAPTSDLPLSPASFPEPVPPGYNSLVNLRQSEPTTESWATTFTVKGEQARLIAAGGAPTRVLVGDGGVFADFVADPPQRLPTAPTLLERREGAASTIFGNVLDLASQPGGYVKRVTQGGGTASGFATLRIETADGVDVCFASYRAGAYAADGFETDALQAFVSAGPSGPRALSLAGGTFLKAGDGVLRRSAEGLASIEKTANGAYVLANASPTPATVTVTLKALHGLEAFRLDGEGQPKGRAEVAVEDGGAVSVPLEAGARVGFFPPGKVKS